jgi:cytidylate kinase
VVEGRDIGSVVFPDATLKIYLDARPEIRARRRADQTGEDYHEVLAQLTDRDHRDTTRRVSPLTIPQRAVVIDTSDLTFEQVVERVVELATGPTG